MIGVCPMCKERRKLMKEFALELNEQISIIKTEIPFCKYCLEDELSKNWSDYNDGTFNQNAYEYFEEEEPQ